MTVRELIVILEKVEHKDRDVLVIDPDLENSWIDVVDVTEQPQGVMITTSAT
jgi:hypothetical protein